MSALIFHISCSSYLFRIKQREGYSPFNVCLLKYTEDNSKNYSGLIKCISLFDSTFLNIIFPLFLQNLTFVHIWCTEIKNAIEKRRGAAIQYILNFFSR